MSILSNPRTRHLTALHSPPQTQVGPHASDHPVAGKHVLVVGINYAPEPTGIAPYTTRMAEHLSGFAASVTVLTGIPHYPNWRVPGPYRWFLRTRRSARLTNDSGLRVRRLRHYVPRRQNAITRGLYEATFLANAATVRVKNAPDVVIAVTPSLGGAVAAAPIARRHGATLIVVVQDLMAKAASQSGISGGGKVSQATAALERYALVRADEVLVVSEAFVPQLLDYGVAAERINVFPNWTHIWCDDTTPAQARESLGWEREPFTVVHTGNIGLKQDLGNVVEAARLMQDDPSARFVIVGDGSQRASVESQAAGLPNLEFIDPVDDETYPLTLAAADLLVVNERPGVSDMSLPSKLTSYLCAGRPVLAAVGDGGATSDELDRTGGAAVIVEPGRPEAMVDAVRELQSDPDRRAVMAKSGKEYADSTLCEKAALARLDDLMRGCVA